MKRHDMDTLIKRTLEEQTKHMEISPQMSDRILREAKKEKERGSMKFFNKKVLVAAAIVCFSTVTAFAAAKLNGIQGESCTEFYDYAKVEQAEKKLGFDAKTVESFQNGYVFENGGRGTSEGIDENGNGMGKKYKNLTLAYKNDAGNLLALTIEKGSPVADAGEEVSEGYVSQLYKFVPPSYELTEEDKEKEAKGEVVISYGTEKVQENIVENYDWQEGDLYYSLTGFDCEFGEEGMKEMVKEIQAAK